MSTDYKWEENKMEEKEIVEQTTNTENTETQTAEQKEVKTFTQEEVNAMIEARLKRATKNTLSKEEMEKYNAWKESQKTEAEKQTYKNENNELKQLVSIMEKGIAKDEAEFIQFKLNKMEGDFEENLKDYLEKNPKFLQKEEVVNNKTTGIPVNKNTTSQDDGVTAILKAKYPDRF